MIVQISSVTVPQSVVSVQIENMPSRTIPTYQAAEGFVSLCLLQRPFVAYVELLMISIWESEPALNRFRAANWQWMLPREITISFDWVCVLMSFLCQVKARRRTRRTYLASSNLRVDSLLPYKPAPGRNLARLSEVRRIRQF